MMTPKSRRPDLNQCINTLQSLPRDISSEPPKNIGELYVAAVGFLCHLKVDQATLRTIRKQHEDKGKVPKCPPPKETPAITAVVHNQILFRGLLACLSGNTGEVEAETSSRQQPGGRKRTHSFAEHPESAASKAFKVAHSPTISKRTFSYSRPQFNLKTMAATILCIAFEHLDHWPVPLVKAYADDCFGPRSWVDEPACQLLVENLSLCHGADHAVNEADNDIAAEAAAFAVAEFYSKRDTPADFGSKNANATSPTSPNNRLRGRGSFSSTSSAPLFPVKGKKRSESVVSDDGKKVITKGDESDSGDDEEVEIKAGDGGGKSPPPPATKKSRLVSKATVDDGGSSSSSGEEDEEVFVTTKSFDEDRAPRNSPNSKESSLNSEKGLTYPIVEQNLNLARVRQRYFGVNLEYAYLAISSSLSDRLNVKSKSNSSLLQTLPSFTSIPSVRSLITGHLQNWLHSPALSGLARNLFAKTVKMMKNVDPPLPADLEAIDNILAMRLKANQLNAHLENVTAIAKRIPTAAVSHHIYIHLLREILMTMDSGDKSTSDYLKMIGAVHGALPGNLSGEGIAASLLTLLVNHRANMGQRGPNSLVPKLRALIRAIAGQLGSSFDGYQLLQSLLSFNVEANTWTAHDEENKARLMFQCVTLLAVPPANSDRKQPARKSNLSEEEIASLKKILGRARKVLLSWCCADYAPLCIDVDNGGVGNGKGQSKEVVGAGIPDYTSILDGINTDKIQRWLNVMRCVLFMEEPGSPALRRFLSPDGSMTESDSEWQEEARRIEKCFEHGADLDDEMIWIILRTAGKKSGGTPSTVALQLLEHLFECCNKSRKSCLRLRDPKIVWELYKLVEYIPAKRQIEKYRSRLEALEREERASENGNQDEGQRNGVVPNSDKSHFDVPRLAHPAMWWRVTCLVLIMCGSSPEHIGAAAWKEHPTLQALIKMVTSSRYRFPTVDCDEPARDEMKKTEQMMRDEEARVTELLFLPPKPKQKQETKTTESIYGGSRVSKRQRDKREKLLQKQREKEAAAALAEANRRKKMLRSAQKSVMLWDPRKGPRKPPRESADLIFSVGDLFELPNVFQRSIEPDFVLMTIGKTSRGAIERAYDWLIPIISFLPDTIARLPASASCFLLLRAYGTEGEERAQLQKLSAPLLVHVRDSLKGTFGEADAVRAFDLLLTDVASRNPDRRRCARRVLHEAIGKEEHFSDDATYKQSNCSWMINILHVKHVEAIIGDAIKYMSLAVTFERGKTLRSLVLALEKHMAFAKEKGIPGTWDFASMLIGLISSRPAVFTAAMGTFPDLRSLAIRVVHEQFEYYIKKSTSDDEVDVNSAVVINLCQSPSSDAEAVEATLPLALLQSASVLLSIWREQDSSEPSSQDFDAAAIVDELVSMLMRPQEPESRDDPDNVDGLASARIAGSGKSAVTVESWVMLARSRSDFIARRAALTAPAGFLPRLLLCSGLPRASLLTMIDRLGKVGEAAIDRTKTFNQLLVPSATSEWDIGRLGHRREVARKLLGRLSAYSRMYQLPSLEGEEMISFTFLEWLSDACRNLEKPRKSKSKKAKNIPMSNLSSIRDASSILENLSGVVVKLPQRGDSELECDASDMTSFRISGVVPSIKKPTTPETLSPFFEEIFKRNESTALDTWLGMHFAEKTVPPVPKRRRLEEKTQEKVDGIEVSLMLLRCYLQLDRASDGLTSCLVKWIPRLSRTGGCADLWKIIFSNDDSNNSSKLGILLSRCMQCWCHSHVSRCRDWLLSQTNSDDLCLELVVQFLVKTSAQHSIHVECFGTTGGQEDLEWGSSEEFVSKATTLALDCLQHEPHTLLETSLCSRNQPPDCVILILLMARCGRNQARLICQTIVKRIEKADEETRNLLLAVILRLYAYFPQSMNLGVAILRSVLKEAVEAYSDAWLVWRSPLDDQFQDMLESVVSNGAPTRMVQALSEVAKKHPLLILRRFEAMEQALEADATAHEKTMSDDKRGIIHGQSLAEPLSASIGGNVIKVTVRHWGFNFTENLWLALLDVISSVPGEVLFGCGIKMGLPNFLGVYLRLMFVQSQLLTMDRLSRFRGKMSEFFESFRASNMEGWESWLTMKTPGLKMGVGSIMMACNFITHQQAINSVKKSRS